MANASLAESNFYVYLHSRLNTGEPFYIGKGSKRRSCSKLGRNRYWNRIVEKDGGFYTSHLASNIDEEFAWLVEMELIALFRYRMCLLVNMTDGGDGSTGYSPSEQHRMKIANALRGKKKSEKACANMRIAFNGRVSNNKGKTFSAEWRQKISIANTGKTHTQETRAKLSAAHKGKSSWNKGKKLSDEGRAILSAAHKGKPNNQSGLTRSIEVREKIAQKLRGRKLTAEHVANISRGLKERKKAVK